MLTIKVFNYQTGEFQEKTLKPNSGVHDEWIIGRASNCNIVLASPVVSRIHGRIVYRNGEYFFNDFGSTDGSRINNELIAINQSYRLQADDVIRIGEYVLVVEAIDRQALSSVTSSPRDDQANSWVKGDRMVRCVRIIPETEDTKTFCFVDANTLINESMNASINASMPFIYQPGQFVTLELEMNGKTVQRCYSISSSPSRPYMLEITVKRVPAPIDCPEAPPGLVSNWLHDHLSVGSLVKLSGAPMGKFTCAPNPSPKLLLISAGSGITPMISMLRWLYDTATHCDVVFLHSARTPRDIIFKEELEYLTSRRPKSRLAITITRPEIGQPWYGFTGRLNEAMLFTIAPDFRERTVYVCGPDGFMQGVKSLLANLSFPMERYHAESFGVGKQAKPKASQPAAVQPPASNRPAIAMPTDVTTLEDLPSSDSGVAESSAAAAQIVFSKSAQEVTCDEELSILEWAEQAGVKIRSSCKQGVCGACRVRKVEGEIQYEGEPDALDDGDRQAGYILPCIAAPVGRVVLEV